MENSPDLTCSTLKPPRRRTAAIAIAIAGSAGLLTIGALIGKVVGGGSMVPVAAPVFVDVPKAPAPVVTVNVPPPPPLPAPPPAPEPPPAPAPRALSPHLDAACLVPAGETAEVRKACTWDSGFPAISSDGALIARLHHDPHPLGMGGDGVAVVFADAKTARVVRQEVLLSKDRDHEYHEGTGFKLRPGVQARLERKVAALQRTLDAQGFRSLRPLGWSDDGAAPASGKGIRAELDDNAVRIVDRERSVVLWRHRFAAHLPDPNYDPAKDMCGGGMFRTAMLWWDPATRLVLADLAYTTGGCMCPTVGRTEVHHLPAEAFAR